MQPPTPLRMTKKALLDLSFIEIRAKLLEVAAFLDRLDRAEGDTDFRIASFRQAIKELSEPEAGRVRRILELLSDPTLEPVEAASGKSAAGAWPEFKD